MSRTQTILIGGASGAVGEAITRSYLEQGKQVIAVVRSESRKLELKEYLGKRGQSSAIHFVVNAYETQDDANKLQNDLVAFGQIDLAIASLGGWYTGSELYNLPHDDWEMIVNNSLSSHFRFSKVVISLLIKQGKGTYAMINGGAAEFAVPNSGVISIMAAAQKMMTQILHNETKHKNVNVFGIGAFSIVKTRFNMHPELWLTAERIGKYILELSEIENIDKQPYWHRIQQPQDLELGA
jgi:NADP-dependent 3-hydroxy acid dehydrogenase YdfG